MRFNMTEGTKEEFRSIVKGRCLAYDTYEGHKKTIVKCNSKKHPWAIVHQCDLFGTSSENYDNLDEAVYDFVELWAVYG